MDESSFKAAIQTAKIPILVLDQKWHRLFAISGKPDTVLSLEAELNELLAHQGKLNEDLKEYKKVKSSLMKNIVENMEGTESHKATPEVTKKLEDDKRLIDEANEKLTSIEDELMEIPRKIQETNRQLMMETMTFCYGKLRTNKSEIEEVSNWIKTIRIELKKNIIRKQNREINNREIYAYMHDVFGKDVINLFDVQYEKDTGFIKEQEKKETESKDIKEQPETQNK